MKQALPVVAAIGAALLAGSAPAFAHEPAEVIQCRDIVPGATSGVIVFGPLGSSGRNVNANCGFPGPSQGGGAIVIQCSTLGPLTGNFVITPNGHNQGHCKSAG